MTAAPPTVEPETRPPVPRRLRAWLAAAALLALVVAAAGLASPGCCLAGPAGHAPRFPARRPSRIRGSTSSIPDLAYDPTGAKDPYAVYPQVHLSYWGYPYDRVLIRFDLRQLPPGAAGASRLCSHSTWSRFLNEDVTEPLPATVSAFRLHDPWEPETATFNAPWSQPGLASGVDYEAQPLGSHSLHGSDWLTPST